MQGVASAAPFIMNITDLKQPEFKAGLFDLDGVVLDTESQYTCIWEILGREYHPEIPDFAHIIKGQTLVQISKWFTDEQMVDIVDRINKFESQMSFDFIPGVEEYLKKLKAAGIRTAVVTSSNNAKMENVWRSRPELRGLFDRILTSEDFKASKPDPDCYLLGARVFDALPSECVVFEDSFAGVNAGKSAGCRVVGLATTNPASALEPLCDIVIPDFSQL